MRLFSATNGTRKLNFNAYNNWKNAKASANVVAKLFGSWWRACRAADCFGSRLPNGELTAELLCTVLIAAAADPDSNPNHRIPSARVIAQYARKTEFPLTAKHFNSVFPKGSAECWRLIVDTYERADAKTRQGRVFELRVGQNTFSVTVPAHLDPLQIERTRNSNVSPHRMLDSLRAFALAKNDNRFSCYEYDEWPEKVCNAASISKKFQGWAKAMQEAGLSSSTTFIRDLTSKALVQYLINAVFDKDCNPTNRCPDREVLQRYGDKTGVCYTHYHYELMFGSIRKCWDRILDWQAGRLSEQDLLSAAKPKTGMRGFIYLIRSGSSDEYTIGKTSKPVRERLKAYRTHHPDPKLVASKLVSDMDGFEKELHKKFEQNRRGRTEWFRLDSADVSYLTNLLSD